MRNFGGRRRIVAAMAAILSCAFCAAFAAGTLTYHSPEVGCDWLDAEYETIKVRADPNVEEPPAVTKEGVMMTFGMILSLPFLLFSEAFGEKNPQLNFSRDAADIAAAAEAKGCSDLLALMAADKVVGKYPPPPPKKH